MNGLNTALLIVFMHGEIPNQIPYTQLANFLLQKAKAKKREQ